MFRSLLQINIEMFQCVVSILYLTLRILSFTDVHLYSLTPWGRAAQTSEESPKLLLLAPLWTRFWKAILKLLWFHKLYVCSVKKTFCLDCHVFRPGATKCVLSMMCQAIGPCHFGDTLDYLISHGCPWISKMCINNFWRFKIFVTIFLEKKDQNCQCFQKVSKTG